MTQKIVSNIINKNAFAYMIIKKHNGNRFLINSSELVIRTKRKKIKDLFLLIAVWLILIIDCQKVSIINMKHVFKSMLTRTLPSCKHTVFRKNNKNLSAFPFKIPYNIRLPGITCHSLHDQVIYNTLRLFHKIILI